MAPQEEGTLPSATVTTEAILRDDGDGPKALNCLKIPLVYFAGLVPALGP